MSNEDAAPKDAPNPPPPVDVTIDAGRGALKNGDYEGAVEVFGAVLEQSVKEHGELSETCALPGYYYGLSLLNLAQTTQEALVASKDTQGEKETSDLSVAWEALECARRNFERSNQTPDHSRLADVHIALGDVACEDSNFESALTEYTRSLDHLNALKDAGAAPSDLDAPDRVGGIHRRYCEVYYKLCLACEFLEDPVKAIDYCTQAIDSIKSEIETVGEGAAEMGLLEIENDLKERKEVIEIAIKERDRVKDMLKQLLERSAAPEASDKEPAAIDLGVVGRGVQRLQPAKIEEEATSSVKKRIPCASNEDEEDQPTGKKMKLENRGPSVEEPKDA